MHKIEIPETLKTKLDSFCKAFVLPDILKLCEECGLSDKETNLVTRYVKSFLSFKKQGNIADVETIEGLIWNERFMNAIEDISELYPFVMDIRREMVDDTNAEGEPVRYACYWLGGTNGKSEQR